MGEKVGRGGGAVMADEMGEGMQCSDHPYRSNPGGICAFCLQEKLGKLVSSSKFSDPFFSIPPPPSSSSSSPPSFPPSDLPVFPSSTRISFLSAKHRRTKTKTHSSTAAHPNAESLTLNRSKSVAPRPPRGEITAASDSPRKKSFWSFLTLSYSSSASSAVTTTSFATKRRSTSSAASSSAVAANCASELPKAAKEDDASAGNDDASPSGSQASSSFGRKVARSRSVGCGSRSFSGDFLERISNGFGDCTLRRVESHREAKQKASSIHRHENEDEEQRIKERIKCGGIFVGLGMNTYWLSATAAADACGDSMRLPAARRSGVPHGRTKSWAWAFASPMRAFRPGGGGGGGQTTIITAGGDVAGGGRIH